MDHIDNLVEPFTSITINEKKYILSNNGNATNSLLSDRLNLELVCLLSLLGCVGAAKAGGLVVGGGAVAAGAAGGASADGGEAAASLPWK